MSIPYLIRLILDFFYPIFKRFISKQTYYYAACGGSNLVLSWLLFFLFYQFVFQKKLFYIDFISYTFSAYTLSSFCCAVISFLIGFWLMRYVVFTESELKGRVQFFRYGLSGVVSALLNWCILKLLIEGISFYPSVANVISSCLVVVFSYLMQRKFSFK